ncbi:MAG TPA: hypothetical protein VK586_01110 [Streptosporangiaceae bacterium]|nr:hypothetical protein [Streptosporangiaceae bacterium]
MIAAVLLAEPIDILPALALAACGAVSFASACLDIARTVRSAA